MYNFKAIFVFCFVPQPEVDDDFDMLLLRARNTLSSTPVPLILYIDAINLVSLFLFSLCHNLKLIIIVMIYFEIIQMVVPPFQVAR